MRHTLSSISSILNRDTLPSPRNENSIYVIYIYIYTIYTDIDFSKLICIAKRTGVGGSVTLDESS